MTRTAAVVVLYDPEISDVIRNIGTYADQAGRLYIVDNSPVSRAELIKGKTGLFDFEYIINHSNKGIAFALNQGAALAREAGYEWLLTMDQDSAFDQGQATGYINAVEQMTGKEQVAVVGLSHSKEEQAAAKETFSEVSRVITSGSMINLRLWEEIGGFDNRLFIDEVDHEYGYRAISRGLKVLLYNGVLLQHRLGKTVRAGIAGVFKKNRIIHSPRRMYFVTRNYLFVRKKYKNLLPSEFRERDRMMRTMIKNNLLFSGSFFRVMQNIWKGYRDYRENDFSAAL
jgi:rhamnosyltransferase